MNDKVNEVADLPRPVCISCLLCLAHHRTHVCNRDWSDHRRQEIDEDDESHRKAAETAELIEEDELRQVVDSRVDPSSPLGQENAPLIGGDGEGMRVSDEFGLVSREVFEDEGCQITIFTKVQQILHVQGIDAILRIVLDHLVRDEERFVAVRRPQPVHREAARQAGDGAKERFEGFCKMVGNEVLVDLQRATSGQSRCDHVLCKLLTCIIVMSDCFALASSVSPQTPMIFLSCIMLHTNAQVSSRTSKLRDSD